MFSTVQLDYINGLVAPMREQGYTHYLAFTDNTRSSSNEPDLYIYFAKEEIFATDLLSYDVPGDSVLYSVRTGNASTNNQYARVSVSDITLAVEVVIDDTEFVSTNAAFVALDIVQPNFTVGEVGQYEMQGGILCVVIVFLFLYFFNKLFRR